MMLVAMLGLLTGCGTLNPAGVYNDDKVLYNADMTIATSYEGIHAFVLWEYNNRAALAAKPEIKAAADKMRIGAPLWFASAFALRDAYAATPNTGTQAALGTALSVLRAALTEATRYLATEGAMK